MAGYKINAKYTSAGGDATEDVTFETYPFRRATAGTMQQEEYETKDLFKDANLHVQGMFAPLETGAMKAKDLTIKANYTNGTAKLLGFEHGLPLEITIRGACKP
jgi:hypothetical protein